MSFEEGIAQGGSPDWVTNDQANRTPRASTPRASILLIEDHPLIYDGLLALFRHTDDFELVSCASDATTALSLARYQQPDIILLDIELAESNGLDLVSQLRRICPDARITVLTAHREPEYLMSSLRLGVQALLQKDMSGDAILLALRKVLSQEVDKERGRIGLKLIAKHENGAVVTPEELIERAKDAPPREREERPRGDRDRRGGRGGRGRDRS